MLTQEHVKAAYDKDQQRLGQKVHDPAVLPVSFDDLTAQWFTGTLCRNHPGAEVVDYRLEPVEQGTTNRARVHVVYNAAGEKAGLPARLFCKASQGLSNRITLGLSGAAEAEVNFYNCVRLFVDIEAPRAAWANAHLRVELYRQRCDIIAPLTSERALQILHPPSTRAIWMATTAKIGIMKAPAQPQMTAPHLILP